MKLIKTDYYLLCIDEDSKIEKGWKGIAYKDDVEGKVFNHFYTQNPFYQDAKIVVAYLPICKECKELDLPLLPEIPNKEVDIVALAVEKYGDGLSDDYGHYSCIDQIEAFKEGYLAAQPKQFTLDDMEESYYQGRLDNADNVHTFDEFIKSLNPVEYPKEFAPEYETDLIKQKEPDFFNYNDGKHLNSNYGKLKTIINSQGKSVLVGEYKY